MERITDIAIDLKDIPFNGKPVDPTISRWVKKICQSKNNQVKVEKIKMKMKVYGKIKSGESNLVFI